MKPMIQAILITCCCAGQLSAQPSKAPQKSVTQRVESALRSFSIAQNCLIKPEVEANPRRVQVVFPGNEGYLGSDLVGLFKYMASDKLRLSVWSMDMGKPDPHPFLEIWRPNSFEVVDAATRPNSELTSRFEQLTALLQGSSDIDKEVVVESLKLSGNYAVLSLSCPASSTKKLEATDRSLEQLKNVASIVRKSSISEEAIKRVEHRWKINFTAAVEPAAQEVSRFEIGVRLLEVASEFEIHPRMSLGGMSATSGLIRLNLIQETECELDTIHKLGRALENCHSSLSLAAGSLESRSLANGQWKVTNLGFDIASPSNPGKPSMRRHLESTTRAIDLLAKENDGLQNATVRLADGHIDVTLRSSSSKAQWIRSVQSALEKLPGLHSMAVQGAEVSATSSQLYGIKLKFDRPPQDLEEHFLSSMEGSRANIKSVTKNNETLKVELNAPRGEAATLLTRLLSQVEALNAKSMTVRKSRTTKSLIIMTISYQLN